jgi:Methyltransferase domain
MSIRRRAGIWQNTVRLRLARRRLLRRLPKGAVAAEVGVWQGDGTAAMLRHARPRALFLIDPWEHQSEHRASLYGGEDGQRRLDEVHASVLARFAEEIERGQVKVLRARSDAATAEFDENQLDWAWIDGDHTYDAVKGDLDAFARIVRPGGYLAGDDYIVDWWRDDVIRAVDEFVAAGRGTVEIIGRQHFLIRLSA